MFRTKTVMLWSCVCVAALVISMPLSLAAKDKGKDQIEVGYAIITPTGGTGLVVFETFGQQQGNELTQAGVLPSDMTTSAMLFVEANGRLSKDTGVAIANPGPNPATVTLALLSEGGKQIASTTFALPAHNQTGKFVTELFANHASVPRDFAGTLLVSSSVTDPVCVAGLRYKGHNSVALPVTSLSAPYDVPSLPGGIGGKGAVVLAQFAAGGGWASEIVLANAGTSQLTARVDLFKQDGTPLSTTLNGVTNASFTDIVVPAGGVFILSHDH